MHRDVKIGLILGVILVAVVAALFFRREPLPSPISTMARMQPSPQRLKNIDDQLAREAGSPYLVPAEQNKQAPKAASAPKKKTENARAKRNRSRRAARHANQKRSNRHASRQPAAKATADNGAKSSHVPWKPIPPPNVAGARAAAVARHASTQPNGQQRPTAKTYRIREGDTLWELAARHLGDGSRYRSLLEANRSVIRNADRLPVGLEIVIPSNSGERRVAEAGNGRSERTPSAVAVAVSDAKGRPASDPDGRQRSSRPRTYTVTANDTLSGIAAKVYGDAGQYRRIYEANRDRMPDADTIVEGAVLRIP